MYAQNADCIEYREAFEFVAAYGGRVDVVICELVLVELYLLLRNPAVLSKPLSAIGAVKVCATYRRNPNWRLVENAPIMPDVWELAAADGFPRRRIIDVRLALTLQHHGVTELATVNTRDFDGLGFARVWNPIASA